MILGQPPPPRTKHPYQNPPGQNPLDNPPPPPPPGQPNSNSILNYYYRISPADVTNDAFIR